jgi:hypothetical protein
MSKWVFVGKESGGLNSWVPLDWKRRIAIGIIIAFVFGFTLGAIIGSGHISD